MIIRKLTVSAFMIILVVINLFVQVWVILGLVASTSELTDLRFLSLKLHLICRMGC